MATVEVIDSIKATRIANEFNKVYKCYASVVEEYKKRCDRKRVAFVRTGDDIFRAQLAACRMLKDNWMNLHRPWTTYERDLVTSLDQTLITMVDELIDQYDQFHGCEMISEEI